MSMSNKTSKLTPNIILIWNDKMGKIQSKLHKDKI